MSVQPSVPSASPAAASRRGSMVSIIAALAANLAIAAAKGTAAALTGSSALFAETFHTLADAGNEVLLFVAVRRSSRPADASHPLGYGQELYFWALLAAIGMFLVGGAVSVFEGVTSLISPPELDHFWVGVTVLLVALALDGASRVVALRQLRKEASRRGLSVRTVLRESPDPTLTTVYLEDTVDVLGALLALLALVLHKLTGAGWVDPVATIAIGLLLGYVATRLTRRNKRFLSNQAVPSRYVDRFTEILLGSDDIAAVRNVEAIYLGAGEALVAAEVVVAGCLTGDDVARALERAREQVIAALPAVSRLYLTPVETRP